MEERKAKDCAINCSMPGTQYLFTLTDARKLCYALYGPVTGKPVFYFHGTPSSRLEPLLLNASGKNIEALLQQYHIFLIAVDRPGIGFSSYNTYNSFRAFAGDIQQLAQHLRIAQASIIGWSGAGPYVLSVAAHFPHLAQQVCLITAFTRSFSEPGVFKALYNNKYYFGIAKYAPWLLKAVLRIVSRKPSGKALPRWLSGLPDVDYNYMKTPSWMKQFSDLTIYEACINGSKGAAQEAGNYFKPTGYSIGQLQQPVHYWWGTADNVVPLLHPKAIEEQAPNATMHYKQGEGHLSVFIRYFEEVLQTIAKQ